MSYVDERGRLQEIYPYGKKAILESVPEPFFEALPEAEKQPFLEADASGEDTRLSPDPDPPDPWGP